MKFSLLITIGAVLSLIFGLIFLFLPVPLMAIYGISLDATGEWLSRLVGAAWLGIGVLNWLAKNENDGSMKAILWADLIFTGAGLLVTLLAHLSGVGNSLLWVTILVYLLLTLGFMYFAFAKPAQS
jgi:hypothetical protein